MAVRKLLEKFESPGAVLRASRSDLEQFMPAAVAEQLRGGRGERCGEKEAAAAVKWCQHPEHRIITLADPDYPSALLGINTKDPPPLLYVRGDPRALSSRPLLAVVGSRNSSAAGNHNAEIFSRTLTEAGVNIVSGLAQGIDTHAHKGALAGGGQTVAVMGTGADIVYPKSNRLLAMEIIKTGGAIVSDLPLGTLPHGHNFPRRNRIVSGLAKGCLVIEASLRSGALITAACANEQGREVFATPGSINSPMHKGCHRLIKQGAKLAENIDDILDELHIVRRARDRIPQPPANGELLSFIDFEPTALDDIAERSGLPADSLLADLLTLEVEGKIIASASGYQRI